MTADNMHKDDELITLGRLLDQAAKAAREALEVPDTLARRIMKLPAETDAGRHMKAKAIEWAWYRVTPPDGPEPSGGLVR